MTHAILGTDYTYSSIVFFNIRSADAKLKLADGLCRAHFSEKVIVSQWKAIHKDLSDAAGARNKIAHFEVSIVHPAHVPPGDSQWAITPHTLDDQQNRKGSVKAAFASGLLEIADGYFSVARDVLNFVNRHFDSAALQATFLPRYILQILEILRTDPKAGPPQLQSFGR